MSAPTPSKPPHRSARSRRPLLAAAIVLLIVGGGAAARWPTTEPQAPPVTARPSRQPDTPGTRTPQPRSARRVVRIEQDGIIVAQFLLAKFSVSGRFDRRSLRTAVLRRLPRFATARSSTTTITYANQRQRTARRVLAAAGGGGGDVTLARTPIASRIAAPVLRQSFRDDCEAAALSTLLRSVGVSISQERLQAQLPRAYPLDPQIRDGIKTWGDPDRGFVGRVRGGGFGVYQAPVAALSRRHHVPLRDLTGADPAQIYRRLLEGHAVFAWVGLADGPYATWRSPANRTIRVNLNEHAVVLRGVARDGSVSVANPLRGTAETWTAQKFEAMWRLLGRRALST